MNKPLILIITAPSSVHGQVGMFLRQMEHQLSPGYIHGSLFIDPRLLRDLEKIIPCWLCVFATDDYRQASQWRRKFQRLGFEVGRADMEQDPPDLDAAIVAALARDDDNEIPF